ncbi:MAG: hypothetical protein JWN22_70 [Nocardioides sp.]|jgi:hypothetical protein|nr:hypothetical protein [Nocardioides sp.]
MGDHAQYDLAARQAAHVLVDMLSVFDEDDLPERAAEMGAAMSLAFRRITEVGAVTAGYDPANRTLDLDLNPLLAAAVSPMNFLVTVLERSTDLTRDEIIVLMREFVDHRFA